MEIRQRKKEKTSSPKKQQPEVSSSRNSWKIFFGILACVIILPICVLVLIPCPVDPVPTQILDFPPLEGPLAVNERLQQAEHIFENKVNGPESMVYHNGVIYTGTSDGKVIRIFNGIITTVTQFGQKDCNSEETCGRPLGMRISESGTTLYVIDAYYGLFAVDLNTNRHKLLWPTSAGIGVDNKLMKFPNDLDVSVRKKIYFTDTSTKWHRKDFAMILMEGQPLGRLIEYDMSTNTTRVLMTGLLFANGVQLGLDESYVLVADSMTGRILKYHLVGPKAGKSEIFAQLPGFPDNIRRSRNGGYWVGLASVQKNGESLTNFLADKPYFRGLVSKFGNSLIRSALQKYGIIIELDKNGKVVQSLHDPTANVVSSVSQVEDTGTQLYLGSFEHNYISVLDE